MRVGALDPQPGGDARNPCCPKRKKFEGDDAGSVHHLYLCKVPADTENGGEVWDEILALVKAKLVEIGLYSEDDKIPAYESLIAALHDWLHRLMAPELQILDACCGGRMWWWDKNHTKALYRDTRERPKGFRERQPGWSCEPDILGDFRDMPFDDESFMLVLFDPLLMRSST